MKTSDCFWVGLKLLGLYFLIAGVAQLATAIHFYLRHVFEQQKLPQGMMADIYMNAVYQLLTPALVDIVAGILLLCCTGLFVKRPRYESDESDS